MQPRLDPCLGWVDQILLTRGGGAVKRAHGMRYNGSYTVAEHSWGVAMLLMVLFPTDFKRLVQFALIHDVPECLTGDVPSTVKESSSASELDDAILNEFGLPPMTMGPRERQILKACDRLELYLWAREQVDMGNKFAQEVVDNLDDTFAFESGSTPGAVLEVVRYIKMMPTVPNRARLLSRIKEAHGITE